MKKFYIQDFSHHRLKINLVIILLLSIIVAYFTDSGIWLVLNMTSIAFGSFWEILFQLLLVQMLNKTKDTSTEISKKIMYATYLILLGFGILPAFLMYNSPIFWATFASFLLLEGIITSYIQKKYELILQFDDPELTLNKKLNDDVENEMMTLERKIEEIGSSK